MQEEKAKIAYARGIFAFSFSLLLKTRLLF